MSADKPNPLAIDPLSPPHFPGLAADPPIGDLLAELERVGAMCRALRQACWDTGNPEVPTEVAAAVKALCDWGESTLPRERPVEPDAQDTMRWALVQRLNRAVRWLREAEDMERMRRPAWPAADRIRDIYEQITADLLDGRTTVPPLRERLSRAEDDLAAALIALDDLCERQGDYPTDLSRDPEWAAAFDRARAILRAHHE